MGNGGIKVLVIAAVLTAVIVAAGFGNVLGGVESGKANGYRNFGQRFQSDSWSDTFTDESKITFATNISVSDGDAKINASSADEVWTAVNGTTTSYNRYAPQLVLDTVNNKLYYTYYEHDGSYYQIWTASMNTGGTGWNATKRTTTNYHSYNPQLVLDSANKLCYTYYEYDGSYNQIWTASMNTDGTGWNATKRTTTNYSKYYPQLVLDSANSKLYFTYQESDDSYCYQIWTANMSTDGTGWNATKRTTTNYNKYYPQLVLDSANSKLYFTYQESDGSYYYQIWTANMSTDGTGWNATKRTTTNYGSCYPQLVLDSANNKLYYTYYESDGSYYYQIWTASMNTNGTGWSAAKRTTTSYSSYNPQLVLDSANNKLYYTYYEPDGSYNQIWTASMNTGGTGWNATKRTTTNYYSYDPQLVLDSANNKLYYTYYEYDGSCNQVWTASMDIDGIVWDNTQRTITNHPSYHPQLVLDSTNNKLHYTYQGWDGSYYQIWTASMNTDGTGWNATKRTTTNYYSYDPQLVLDSANNKLYYTYYEPDGSYNQIWTASMNTNGTGWNATKRTTTSYSKYYPQLVLDSANSKLYFTYQESDDSYCYQIWTASMNTNGTGWTATKRTTTNYNKYYPQLVLDSANSKLYFTYQESDGSYYNQIWTASMNANGTDWSATKRTTTNYHSYNPQLVLDSANKLCYTYYEYDGSYNQIWTASMNTNGTDWTATNRTTTNYHSYNPQLVLDSANKLYYTYYEHDGSYYQIWTASMNTDGTGWSATKRTTTNYGSYNPQLVLDTPNNKLYYTYYGSGGTSQIWTATLEFVNIYYSSAELTSIAITPTSLQSWDRFYANDTVPPETSIIYEIWKGDGSAEIMDVVNGQDISSITELSIKLKAILETTNTTKTPAIHDWSVTWLSNSAPTVTLESPGNDLWLNSKTVDFKYTPIDDYGFTNCSLWTNETGVFALTKLNTTPVVNNTVNTIQHIFSSDGIYSWNIKCYDNAITTQSAFAASNWVVKIDTMKPSSSVNALSQYQNTASFLVQWAGSNDRSMISNYTIYVSDNDSAFTVWLENTTLTSSSYDSADGHRYAFYSRAKDHAGNFEDESVGNDTWTIVDTTPPTNPTYSTELGGTYSNTWQNSVSDPAFTWSGQFDNTSDINGFYYYWGPSSTGTSTNYTTATSYDPPAPGEGTYYLRILTRDNAGNNATTWVTIFVFKYDGTPPTNPTSCLEFSGVQNNTWQNSVSIPGFNWDGTYDALCGINGYYYYLGKNMYGTSTNYTTTPSCTPLAPGEGTFYFRVLAKDNAGNNATSWKTMFVFKYDGTQPTGTISINAGAGYTNTTSVTLTLTYNDATSNVAQVIYSNDGSFDTEIGEDASNTKDWTLTAGDGTKTVYYQIKDNAGLVSTTCSDTIILDTTPPAAVTDVSSVARTADSITLTWSGSTDAAFKQYVVYKATKPDFLDATIVATIMDKETTEYTVSNLSPGTTYYFKIKTVDNVGLSTYSALVSVATEAEAKEEINWLLIGGIIAVVIAAVIAVAVVMLKKRKGKAG